MPQWSLVDGAALGTWGGALAGVLVYELMHYWYHRAAHAWNWLWRLGHQMLAAAFLAFNAAFQHASLRTPRWLGWLVQRPESHAVHHGRGIHRGVHEAR